MLKKSKKNDKMGQKREKYGDKEKTMETEKNQKRRREKVTKME